jgi:hypothetical protein
LKAGDWSNTFRFGKIRRKIQALPEPHITAFRKFLLITSSRRLGVMSFGLLSYRGDNDNAMKKNTYPNEQSRGNLPLEIASFLSPNSRFGD